jgi:hypothetical protein
LQRGGSQSSGGLSCITENVAAPDALCFADDPASGAARFAQSEAGRPQVSNLATYRKVDLRSETLRLPGGTAISVLSPRRLLHNAGYWSLSAHRAVAGVCQSKHPAVKVRGKDRTEMREFTQRRGKTLIPRWTTGARTGGPPTGEGGVCVRL